jgi:hypothetical protein
MILLVSNHYHRAKAKAMRQVRALLSRIMLRAHQSQVSSITQYNIQAPLARLRFSACEKCPFLTQRASCLKCGCFMPLKVQLTNAKCPEGKW